VGRSVRWKARGSQAHANNEEALLPNEFSDKPLRGGNDVGPDYGRIGFAKIEKNFTAELMRTASGVERHDNWR
jgi:hypothetical protein